VLTSKEPTQGLTLAGVPEVIERAGACLLYLPSYSPDLNPIQQVFAKLKSLLRTAACRTREALWNTIGKLLAGFSAKCANYFAHSGYGISGESA
jgi:transposase